MATDQLPRSTLSLPVVAFAAGWTLMMLEILGGRLMAPHFGYSVYQWGALIGVVMGFMAAGYWAGGQLGDGRKAAPLLGLALLTGAIAAGLTPWIGRPMLAAAASRLDTITAAIVGATLILGVPSFALAMASPLCAGLSRLSGGAAAGRIAAVSTLGSIGGTFFAAFYAIPELGVSTGYALATAPPALACLLLPGWRLTALAAVLLAPLAWAGGRNDGRAFAYYRETPYNTIMVRENAHEVGLHLNVRWVIQSRLRKDGGPTGLYYDLVPALPALAGGTRTLILGLAGGTAATGIQRAWPGADILGVELDPAVVEVARDRFGLKDVRVAVADARRFIDTSTEQHDVAIVDLYSAAMIPFFTATQEFFAAVAMRLAPGGVAMMNVIAPMDRDVLVGPLAATLATSFPSVFLADAGRGNWLLIATKEYQTIEEMRERLRNAPQPVQTAAKSILGTLTPAESAGQPVLTDDRSDIERRSLRAIYGASLRRLGTSVQIGSPPGTPG